MGIDTLHTMTTPKICGNGKFPIRINSPQSSVVSENSEVAKPTYGLPSYHGAETVSANQRGD